MPPDTRYFLSRVSYSSEKKQVTAEFSNSGGKATMRYAFFPMLHFGLKGISRENFLEFLSAFDSRRLRADFSGDTAVVFAATFGDLKALSNRLADCFGSRNNLIEPERQFLIGKKWDYFDCFVFRGNAPEKVPFAGVPDASVGFLSEPVTKTLSDLVVSRNGNARDFASRIALSRILKIPPAETELSKPAAEIFFENIFFGSGIPVPSGPVFRASGGRFFGKGFCADFSKALAVFSSMPFNNLGFETVDCACGAAGSQIEGSAHGASLVRVRFLREGFYFDPVSVSWAREFHLTNQGKTARELRRKEYSLGFFPAGPFARGGEADILLFDALRLRNEGSLEIIGSPCPPAGCMGHESFFSSEVNRLYSWLSSAESLVEGKALEAVASNGLFFSREMESKPDVFYWKALGKCISGVLSSLYPLATSPESRFFRAPQAFAFEVVAGDFFSQLDVLGACAVKRLQGSSRAVVERSRVQRVSSALRGAYGIGACVLSPNALSESHF